MSALQKIRVRSLLGDVPDEKKAKATVMLTDYPTKLCHNTGTRQLHVFLNWQNDAQDIAAGFGSLPTWLDGKEKRRCGGSRSLSSLCFRPAPGVSRRAVAVVLPRSVKQINK